MSDDRSDDTTEMTRAEVTAFEGPLVLEFGAAWCGYCRTLAPAVAELVRQFPQVTHVKIEDGPGKPLGRSFQVKLWPTLVFLRDGQVQKIAVRPAPAEVREGFETITAERPVVAQPGAKGTENPAAGDAQQIFSE